MFRRIPEINGDVLCKRCATQWLNAATYEQLQHVSIVFGFNSDRHLVLRGDSPSAELINFVLKQSRYYEAESILAPVAVEAPAAPEVDRCPVCKLWVVPGSFRRNQLFCKDCATKQLKAASDSDLRLFAADFEHPQSPKALRTNKVGSGKLIKFILRQSKYHKNEPEPEEVRFQEAVAHLEANPRLQAHQLRDAIKGLTMIEATKAFEAVRAA